MTTMTTANLVSRKQAAETLGVHPNTIDRLVKRGQLERFKVGGVVRFDIRAFIAAHLRAEGAQE